MQPVSRSPALGHDLHLRRGSARAGGDGRTRGAAPSAAVPSAPLTAGALVSAFALAALMVLPVASAALDTRTFTGRYECAMAYFIVTGDCEVAAGYAWEMAMTQAGTAVGMTAPAEKDPHAHYLRLRNGWKELRVELTFTCQLYVGPKTMSLLVELPQLKDTTESKYKYAQVQGPSGTTLVLHPGAVHPTSTGTRALLPTGQDIILRALPVGSYANSPRPGLVGAGFWTDEDYTIKATVVY